MGYPDNVLAADEQVVLHRHPHWKRLIGPVLALVIGTAVAAFVAAVVDKQNWGTAKTVVQLVILAVWLLIVGWLTVWPFLTWLTTHFVITDRRVMFRHGLLTRTGIDIPLARINSVEFRHGLIDRMVRTGTLIIESASQDPLEFNDIPQVERVHSLLFSEEEIRVALGMVEDALRGGYCVLAAQEGERLAGYRLAGPTPLTESTWHLYWLCVHPDFQRRGVARTLQSALEGVLGASGGKRIVVETASRPDYDPARAFYRSAGYDECGRIADYYRPGDACVFFSKVLT